jgi:hypothetical protein
MTRQVNHLSHASQSVYDLQSILRDTPLRGTAPRHVEDSSEAAGNRRMTVETTSLNTTKWPLRWRGRCRVVGPPPVAKSLMVNRGGQCQRVEFSGHGRVASEDQVPATKACRNSNLKRIDGRQGAESSPRESRTVEMCILNLYSYSWERGASTQVFSQLDL